MTCLKSQSIFKETLNLLRIEKKIYINTCREKKKRLHYFRLSITSKHTFNSIAKLLFFFFWNFRLSFLFLFVTVCQCNRESKNCIPICSCRYSLSYLFSFLKMSFPFVHIHACGFNFPCSQCQAETIQEFLGMYYLCIILCIYRGTYTKLKYKCITSYCVIYNVIISLFV